MQLKPFLSEAVHTHFTYLGISRLGEVKWVSSRAPYTGVLRVAQNGPPPPAVPPSLASVNQSDHTTNQSPSLKQEVIPKSQLLADLGESIRHPPSSPSCLCICICSVPYGGKTEERKGTGTGPKGRQINEVLLTP